MNSRTPAPDSPERFARRFRLLMGYHDITLGDIAAATHCAISTVGTWKNGRVPSSAAVLDKLAEIFHVRVEYLLAGQTGGGGARLRLPAGNAAGDGSAHTAERVAARILDDLECLLLALEQPPGADGNGHEPPQPGKRKGGGRGGREQPGQRPSPAKGLRRQVESYVRAYLDRAERAPGGLAHAWVQLRREFPLDLYEQLR